MKTFPIILLTLAAFALVACPKEPSKKPVKDDTGEDPVETRVEVPEKGPPPPLPQWVKFPQKNDKTEVKPAVQTLSLLVAPEVRVKIRPPYKIFQTGVLVEFDGQVMMPVRVARENFWLNGHLDMYQIEVTLPGGTVLYDGAKGAEVGFVSAPILTQVKSIEGEWAQVSHEMNSSCSPVFLKVWVKKTSLLAESKGVVPFPAKYEKPTQKTELRRDAALFDIYSTNNKDVSVIQLPMCNNEEQVLLTGTTSGKRTQIMFKPSPKGPLAILGWMDKDIAKGLQYSACTCGNPSGPSKSSPVLDISYDYKTRLPLPLFLTDDQGATPVGVVEATSVKRVVKNIKVPEFGKLEIEEGITFFVPYHENYYEP
jgi:hypothetical protein